MGDSKDIFLGLFGLVTTAYGGYEKDITTIVLGITALFLAVILRLGEQEEDIRVLQAQINTQNELKRIREEVYKLDRKIAHFRNIINRSKGRGAYGKSKKK